ncbi:hypothetical protein GCM10011391_38460 [Pullulanibacillus camelliae]|uniref:N-acetyltransferase domain-containing protein n=1 Tax=Pullulanibacillus camelliae TaxID=1707096 RepID=A0A8J3DZV5_9BACL|nr:hypothetical protein GCM10011391_38460 [Pullulanibacillus camelliae]
MGICDEENQLIRFLLGYTERWLDSDHFYLNEMCVTTERQSMGIGSRLINEFEISLTK